MPLREVVVLREVALTTETLVMAVVAFVVQGLRAYDHTVDQQAEAADRLRTSTSFMRDCQVLPEESFEF